MPEFEESTGFKMKGPTFFKEVFSKQQMGSSPLEQNFELKIGKGQGSQRKGKYTVDLDAPGYKYGPGYESTEEKTIPDKDKK